MLTAWGKKIVACAEVVSGINGYRIPAVTLASSSKAYIEAKTHSNSSIYIPPHYYTTPSFAAITTALVASGSSASYGVAFGTDDTAPTENDCTIGSQITSITVNAIPSTETVFDDVNYRYVARLDYTISNNTGADITIKEIGFFVRFGTATTRGASASTTASNRMSIMIDRTVLDSPVTIPNGTAGVVRYDFAYEG